jgi:uncharacterized protein involved in exopolysaccharide biosynthesis
MRTGRQEERRRQFALVAAAPTDVSEVDRAGAGLEPAHISGFSLLGLSLTARLAMVAVAAVLLWSAVFWALA